MSARPNLLIAATVNDAVEVRRHYPQFRGWHIMTPRNEVGRGWLYGQYVWTPEAQRLPARKRWDLKQRLRPAIDEHSEEKDFPVLALA